MPHNHGTPDRIVHSDDGGGGGGGGPVTQATTPWVVSGTVTADQGTSPWVVSAVDLDIRNLVFATDKVDVSGSSVSVSNFPATVAVTQSTSPWVVSNLVLTDVHDVGNNALNVNVVATTGGGLTDAELRATPVPVSGTVTANQGTSPWVVSGIVTVQDGGNVITVDATNLDIRDLTFAADKVDASGTVLGAGNNNIGDVDVASLPTFGAGQATYAEDAVHATGDLGVFVLGVENSAGTILAPAGDYTPIATDPRGFVIAGVTRSPGGTIGPIDIALLVDNTGSPTASPVGAFGMLYDGANWDMARGTAVDGALVNLGTNNDVTVSGTVTIQDSGNVITVDATDFDIRNLVFATDKVDASGTVLGAGNNNIGDVDVLTLPALVAGNANIGDVDVASIAAGTTRIGGTYTVSGQIIDNDGDVLTVKVAHLDMTTATTTDIVAAVATKKIRVLNWEIDTVEPATVTDVNFVTGAGTTRVTGSPRVRMTAENLAQGRVAATGAFLFETVAGEALRVTQTGATDLTVAVVYVEA